MCGYAEGTEVKGHQAGSAGNGTFGKKYQGMSRLQHIGKVPALTEELLRRGHSDDTVRKFLGENYLRVFEASWGG